MARILQLVVAIVFSVALAAPTVAGIADSPLPELEAGKTTLHLYSVPGFMNGAIDSFVSCTSTDTSTMRVGVEVFDHAYGTAVNDAVATSLSVGPGATVTFGTDYTTWMTVHSVVGGGSPGNPGSARILATSKKLICTAFAADPAYPITTSWQLTIIAKTKQKAAN